jgi:hypothetical protein
MCGLSLFITSLLPPSFKTQGVRTHLRTLEYDALVDHLEAETGISLRREHRSSDRRLGVSSPKDADPLALEGDPGFENLHSFANTRDSSSLSRFGLGEGGEGGGEGGMPSL